LSDHAGPWFSARLETQGDSAKLTVNGKSIELPNGGKTEHEFHVFIDGSLAELICDNQHAITTRIYRKPDGPLGVSANYHAVKKLWDVRPISHDRLTR
jgi:hypothetical protein